MSSIFKNQGGIAITMETGKTLTSATASKILYVKPDATKGQFNASVSGTTLTYTTNNTDFSQPGKWQLQAFVTLGGLDSYGEITEIVIVDNIK